MNQLPATIKHAFTRNGASLKSVGGLEFAIARACAAWPRGPDDLARIRRLVAPGYDPKALRAVAFRHGVAALVADGLRAAGQAVPGGIERIAAARAAAALAHAAEATALHRILADAGVAMLTLKGVALAQRLHGSVALRESADIDVAVAPEAVAAAWGALAAAGYARLRPATELPPRLLGRYLNRVKDSLHRRGDDGALVELHWRLSDEAAVPVVPPPTSWRAIELSPDRALWMLGDESQLAYLSVHGAAHLWARLKWLADIATLLRHSPDGGAAWWASARRGGDVLAVASALILANRLLATPLPAGFVAPRSWRLRLLVAMASKVLRAGGGTRELATTRWRGWAEFAAKLLVAPDAAARASVFARLLVSGEDIAARPLPPALSPLYVVLRVPMLVRRRAARRRARLSALSRTRCRPAPPPDRPRA